MFHTVLQQPLNSGTERIFDRLPTFLVFTHAPAIIQHGTAPQNLPEKEFWLYLLNLLYTLVRQFGP